MIDKSNFLENKISKSFLVRSLHINDIDIIYTFLSKQSMFYRYCPPFVTKTSILKDMEALPEGVDRENKYYLGYFSDHKLIGMLDLVLGYPNSSTVYIGLFIVAYELQNYGLGSMMIQECMEYLTNQGFSSIRLAYAKGNMQSRSFWIKNGFVETGEEKSFPAYTAVLMSQNKKGYQ